MFIHYVPSLQSVLLKKKKNAIKQDVTYTLFLLLSTVQLCSFKLQIKSVRCFSVSLWISSLRIFSAGCIWFICLLHRTTL